MKKKIQNVRAIATLVLADIVIHRHSLDNALTRIIEQNAAFEDKRDRGLVQEIAYGCMRWYYLLDSLANELLEKPLKSKDQDVHLLLLVGLYQLEFLSIKPHAAVAETVAATTILGKPWAKGLLNACLRRFQREHAKLLERVTASGDSVALSHPQWLLQELKRDWPNDWPAIAEQNNQRPPMHLRVNLAKTSREDLSQRLAEAGFHAAELATPCGLALDSPAPVDNLPGFADGEFSVQDVSAQYAAILLEPQQGEKLLDACAAPGGKACHLLEIVDGEATLVAVELDPTRAERIRENLSRLDLSAELKIADAAYPGAWWDKKPFDRILLDAPCSATGVVRRHPDIKYHRTPSDVDKLTELQAALLEALWPLLKRGGKLLYATCSVLARENEQQITRLLDRHTDAREVPVSPTGSIPRLHGVQLLPSEGDGFYYCLVEKI
ncbi:MAG: 16S rRNA (cytosine(967)-C(5))-methyltransferase RsmB [Acidiferrobacterales bacterium]